MRDFGRIFHFYSAARETPKPPQLYTSMSPRPFLLLLAVIALALMAGDADAQSDDRDDGIYVLDKETGDWTAIDNPNPTTVEVGCDEEPTEDQLSESNLAGLLNEHAKILIQDGNDTYYMARCGNGTRQQHNCYDPGGRTAGDNATDPWLDILDGLGLSTGDNVTGPIEWLEDILDDLGMSTGNNGSSKDWIVILKTQYEGAANSDGGNGSSNNQYALMVFGMSTGDNGTSSSFAQWVWTGSAGGNGSGGAVSSSWILAWAFAGSAGGNGSGGGDATFRVWAFADFGLSLGGSGDNGTMAWVRSMVWAGSAGGNVTVGVEYIHDDGLLWLATGVYNDGDGTGHDTVMGVIRKINAAGGGYEPQESDVCDDFYDMYSGIGGGTTASICIPHNTFAAGGNGTLSPQFDCMASCVILSAMFTDNGTVTQANIIKQEACAAPDITEEVDSGNEEIEDSSDDGILISAGGVDVMKRDAAVAGVGATATLTLSTVARRILSRGTDPLLRKRPGR